MKIQKFIILESKMNKPQNEKFEILESEIGKEIKVETKKIEK